MRSSAAAEPFARADEATPVGTVTLYGPSTRILLKPLMPKLWVAASARAASAKVTETAMKKVRMRPPSMLMVNVALRTADVAGAGLAHRAFGAAGNVDVALAHDADVGGAAGMGAHAARTGDRHLGGLRLNCAGVDVTPAGDLIFGRLSFARASLVT